ncbi:MAG: NFACT family protein [Methanobacteriota archaeon]|nr:MAG: NFACT family protein [Euryarchaeota archaeon]
MMKGMSSFDLMAVAQELQILVGGRFEKAFQTRDEISVRVSSKEIGKKEIFSKAGKWLFLRDPRKGEGQPGTFAMVLRKHLSNAVLTKVEQHDFDRVLVLDFEKKESFQLIFELFGRGNAILVKEGKIVNPLRRESWSSREIKIGEDYKFPPSHQNPQSLSQSEFESLIKESEYNLVRTLALDLNLGGQYSEELCHRTEIDKKSQPNELSSEQIGKVYQELQNIFQTILTKKSPNAIIEDEQVVDAAPISLRRPDDSESRAFESISEALEFMVSSLEVDVEELEEEDETARYERRIKQQEEAMAKSMEKEKSFREIADYLHANPGQFEKLLEELKTGTTEDTSVKSINHETSIARISLPDGKEFELNYRDTVYDNADHFYQKAKKEKSKRDRLREEIAKSQQAMEKAVKQRERREKLPKIEPTKQFWFDAYRWFISSEGYLVIAGRDAKSNDRIVKRHLKDGDRYAHADVKGAPSVVVKEGSKATEVTLREACEFSLSFSKAWSSRVGGGSAYWVKPEQVSKRPESGEFLPRGAFVIRGKRNHYRGLELQVAVGEIEYEGSRKVMCGPIAAVETQSKRSVVLRPGDTKKEDIAKELSQTFQVPVDEIARILPPGGVEVV